MNVQHFKNGDVFAGNSYLGMSFVAGLILMPKQSPLTIRLHTALHNLFNVLKAIAVVAVQDER